MAFLPGVFGGDNTVGFFGGGKFVPNQNAFQVPEAGQTNQRYAWGSQWAQDALDPNNPNNPLAQQNAVNAQQGQLAQGLFGTIAGNQPSVAQQQLQQTTQGNMANAYAMAAANPNNPGAARMAANNAAAANQAAAGQGAMLRAQEISGAQGMLGNVLGGQRSQDQGMYQNLNQASLGNLGGQTNLNLGQAQAQQNEEQMRLQGFQGAQSNALGGKLLNAAAGVGAAFAGKAFGGVIPGYASGGDSRANDTVPAMLSPREVVLPRSVTLAADAPERAKAFLEALKKKHQLKRAA